MESVSKVKRGPPEKTQLGSYSSSFWSSENIWKKAQAGENRESSQEGDEALNAAFFGKGGNYNKDNLEVGLDRSLGEREIVGEKPKNSKREIERLSEKSLGEAEKGKTCIWKGNWADILFKSTPNRNEIRDVARDDFEMGLASANIRMEVEEPILSNRALEVVKTINQNPSKEELGCTNPIHSEKPKPKPKLGKLPRNLPSLQEGRVLEGEFSSEAVEDWVSLSDSEENFCNVGRVFFPELESRRERIKRARGVDDSVEWLKQWLKQKSTKALVAGCGGISRYVEGFIRVVFLGPLEGIGADHGESNGSKGGIETFIEAMWSNGLALDGMSRKSFFIA
ncbi:hypothetical protein V6N11_039421 [Hibiscus sabdariffa]|uniref:Uncharacterized protein n=1 Tax=Hibiscus sabdariffa TaxID=183260 RepID=A0ABR2SNK1_9ROSI